MRALEFVGTVPRFVASRAVSRWGATWGRGTQAVPNLRLVEKSEPVLPGHDWVRVRPLLSGICGSDLSALTGHVSPSLGAFTSTPYVPGHEVVGWREDDETRVVVQPALGCRARGVEPPCPECAEGLPALCRNTMKGDVSAGLQIGYCRETSGGWGEVLVAHRSQLHPVPDALDDEDAVMVEPLACALHAVATVPPEPGAVVVVIGAGTLGLMAIAAVRRLAAPEKLIAVAKHRRQVKEARRLGADTVVDAGDLYDGLRRILGPGRLQPEIGPPVLEYGVDYVVDAVGRGESLETAVRIVRPRGHVVLLGMPGPARVDLSPLWQREVNLRGAYAYDDATFGDALALAPSLGLGALVGPVYALDEYRDAVATALRAGSKGHVKVAFAP